MSDSMADSSTVDVVSWEEAVQWAEELTAQCLQQQVAQHADEKDEVAQPDAKRQKFTKELGISTLFCQNRCAQCVLF